MPNTTRASSRNRNANGMSARKAIAILKGERIQFKAEMAQLRLQEARLARAAGTSGTAAADTVTDAEKKVLDAYEYAIAALLVFKKEGKSALKKAAALGLDPNASEPATPPAPAASDDDEYDDEP